MTAQEAVGTQKSDDFKLNPRAHADSLPGEAGPLKRILENDAIRPIMDAYVEADRQAVTYQGQYKKWGRWEIYLTVAAAMIGSVLLYISNHLALPSQSDDLFEVLRKALLFFQALSLAGVAATTYLKRSGGFFKKWMQARTKAEDARIELFETVGGLKDTVIPTFVEEGEIPLLPLQLEYFRRYQLEVQINFCKERGEQHEAAAARFLSRGAVILFLGTLAATAVGYAKDFGDWVNSLAVMGVITPILIGAQSKLSLLGQDERNAVRYGVTLGHLREHQKQIEAARRAAENNEHDRVHSFIRNGNEIVSVENKQWREQAD